MLLQPIKVWNQFDEFGLLAGLAHWSDDGKTLEYVRYPGESNKLLKDRILTANHYRGNGTIQGMLNNISRDLGVSVSGTYELPIYNNDTKKFFFLSEPPYPSASGIRVYVSSSGNWSSSDEVFPQVRSSGYVNATSGWIVWNLPDFDSALIPSGLPGSSGWYDEYSSIDQYPSGIQYGQYTQVLEFLSGSIPNTGDRIRVDYQIQNGVDLYGQTIIDWRSDFSNIDDPIDLRFVGKKSEFPSTESNYSSFKSGHISIFTLDQLTHPTISGVFYETNGKPTSKLVDLAATVNEEYPLYWNKFRYDIGRWDQLDMAAAGSVPSFHNEGIELLSGTYIKGGSKYGVDLDCIELRPESSGTRSPWYPVFIPGEFYIGNERFYMFGKQHYQVLTLVDIGGGVLSGNLTGSGLPVRMGVISAYSSGRFFDEPSGALPNNPYFKRLHDFTNVISGVYYRSPYVDYASSFNPSNLNFNGNNFYYDYDTTSIYASGINPTGFVVAWEDEGVYTSGVFVVYSGGYGLTTFDFNPLTDPFDKILYLK
jgi:hypothetical protein